MSRRAVAVVVCVAVFVLVVLMARPGLPAAHHEPSLTTQEEAARLGTHRPAARRFPQPPAEAAPLPEQATAHATLAEELGWVAIRCFVGDTLDGDNYVGPLDPRVEDGWYTDLVYTLSGSKQISRSSRRFDATQSLWTRRVQTPAFVVSWHADRLGQSVPCTVQAPGHADVTIELVDAPVLEGMRVTVGGVQGRTDAVGQVTLLDVPSDVELLVSVSDAHLLCEADRLTLSPAEPGSHVTHRVRVVCVHELATAQDVLAWLDEQPSLYPDYEAREARFAEGLVRLDAMELDRPTRVLVNRIRDGGEPPRGLISMILGLL
jgi:hypothetical protein